MAFYDTATLLDVLRVQKSITPFWLQFFTRQINFETETVNFDMVYGEDRKLAPFVVPNVQGQVMSLEGYEQRSFKPAYVKPKHVVDPNMVIERQPGEALGTGSMSREQRRNAVIAEILRKHRVLHTNRQEWLAAKAVIDGKVTISGENYPSTLVDFRRHADLTLTLSGGALWTAGTADPLANIRNQRKRIADLSGARASTWIFGGDAWDYFTARVNLKDAMDRNYDGQETRVTLIREGMEGVEYVGRISGLNGAGALDCYVDTSKYVDENGVEQFFLDQKTVVGVAAGGVEGVRCFGAIKDKQAGYRAIEMFPKMWENEDPSVEFLMTQSAPLMVPKNANATTSIKVAA